MKTKSKTQSMMEYTILIGLVGLAILGIHTYARRGIQVVIKLAADPVGKQEDYARRQENVFSVGDPVGPSMTEAQDLISQQSLDVRDVFHGKATEKVGSFQEGISSQITFQGRTEDRPIQ